MPESNEEQPKIIVDSDWKEEARKEKETLEQQAAEDQGDRQIPDPSIAELIDLIAVQVSMALGGMQDPRTGQQMPADLGVAKHYIDLIALIQEKTKGNLDDEEQKLIDGAVHQLRMLFVQLAGVGQGAGEQGPQTDET